MEETDQGTVQNLSMQIVTGASVYLGFSGLMQCAQTLNLVLCVRRESCGKQSFADTALGEIEISGCKINSGIRNR